MTYLAFPRAVLTVALAFGFVLASSPAAAVKLPNKSPNRWVTQGFTDGNLLRSATLAAQYLKRIQLPDGDFVYVKDPMGECCRQKPSYSMVRHFGAVYALLRLSEYTGRKKFLPVARKGLEFAKRFRKRHGKHMVIKGIKSQLSLGELGFFLMDAMLYEKLSGDRQFRPLANSIARFLVANLHRKSPFLTPGLWAEHQALIGLVDHYQLGEDRVPGTLRVLQSFLDFTVEQNKPSHWSQMAFAAFAKIAPKAVQKYQPFIHQSAEQLMSRVKSLDTATHSRFVGSKSEKSFSACGAAARNEGLVASYKLLRGKRPLAAKLDRGIKDHLGYSLQFQYGVKGHLLAQQNKSKRVAGLFNLHGGIYNSPDEGFVRIDFVAHHIRAIIDYLETF